VHSAASNGDLIEHTTDVGHFIVPLPKISKSLIRAEIENSMTDAEQSIANYPVNPGMQLLWHPDGAQGHYAIARGKNSSYRRALLAHVRGWEAQGVHQRSYGHCNNGNGPFQACVVFDEPTNDLQGACTNCAFGGHK